jgi:hypothetical protein
MRTLLLHCLLLLAALAPPAAAHMMKIDGDAGVVIHVDPDDNPVAGEPARVFLEIKHKSPQFKAAACDCRLRISRAGTTVIEQAVRPGDFRAGVASLVFPAGGIYRVAVSGKPAAGAAFKAFQVAFDIRVENGAQAPASEGGSVHAHWPALLAALLAALAAGFAIFKTRKKP